MSLFNTIKKFKDVFDSGQTKHIALNWSEQESCLKHPDLPLGVMVRDQFQLDSYAGRVRSILSGEGYSLHLADWYTVISKNVHFNTETIQQFLINDKHFNPNIFGGSKIPVCKTQSLEGLQVIGPLTKVVMEDGKQGTIINGTPLNSLFDLDVIFKEESNSSMMSPDVEIYLMLKQELGI